MTGVISKVVAVAIRATVQVPALRGSAAGQNRRHRPGLGRQNVMGLLIRRPVVAQHLGQGNHPRP